MSYNKSSFSNQNGVTFGSSGSIVTASVQTNYLTTAMASNRGSDFVQANANFFGTNASGTIASNAISISVNAGGAGDGVNIIGVNGNSVGTNATIQFSNSNNVTFGLNGSTVTASASYPAQTAFEFSNANGVTFGTNGSTVTASVQTNYQSQGAYLTTAGLSQDSSKYAGINGAITGGSLTVNTSGVSINLPAYLTTAQPVGAYLTTARASNDAIGLNSALTANGVSMTANSSGLSLNFPAFLTTAALSNHSHGNPTLNLTNLSGTTASNSAGFTLSLSANAPGAGGGVNIAGGGVTQGTGTVNFGNSNGITFGLSNNGTMTASHNGLTTARASNDAIGLNTAGTNVTWTVNSSGLSFNGSGYAGTGLSLTNATATLNSNGLQLSVAAPGAGAAVTVSASNGSFTVGQLNFSNANNVTFGTSAGSIVTASVAAPGGGAGATYSMFPPFPMPIAVSSVYSGATTTTAGGSRTTVSLYVAPVVIPYAVSFNKVYGHLSMNTSAGTGSVTMGNAYGLYTLNGNSLSLYSSWGMGFFLSQSSVTARTQSWYWGTNSTSNSSSIGGNQSASFARLNQVLYDTAPQTIPQGQYWLVHANTQRSSGLAAALFSYFPVSFSQSTGGSMFGTNVSSRMHQLIGIASTVTSNTRSNNVGDILPPFIETTAITGTGGSSQNRSVVVYFQSA